MLSMVCKWRARKNEHTHRPHTLSLSRTHTHTCRPSQYKQSFAGPFKGVPGRPRGVWGVPGRLRGIPRGLGGSGGSQEASGGPRRLRGVLGGLGGSQKASGGLGKIWPPQASGPPRTLGECHSAMRQAFFVCDNPQMKGRLSFRSHFGSSILVSGSFCDRFKPCSFWFFTGLIDTAWRCDA